MAHKIYSKGPSGNRVILTSHILPTSATMVGVCITVLGLARLMPIESLAELAFMLGLLILGVASVFLSFKVK